MSALADRFRELLGASLSLPADRVEYAADFVRLLTGTTVATSDQFDARFPALCKAVSHRTGLSVDHTRALVRLAQAPEFRGRIEPRDMEAFVARFGAGAGGMLAAEMAQNVDLETWPIRHGSGEALLLLDAMFAVAVSDARIETNELRRLETAATALGIDAVLFAALHHKHDPRHARGEFNFPLTGNRVRIGRSSGADVVLPDPQVALFHAELVRGPAAAGGAEDAWRVVDAESGRPTVLNGRAVGSAPLHTGDELRLGPYTLRIDPDGQTLKVWGARSFTALSARDLSRHIGTTSLLEDVRFTVFSGEVVALVGPSGAGKTTLLNAIAGVTPADSGEVLLDGEDFHRILAVDRSRVGTVPQDDIIHPELSVAESLYYSGRLRFSPDTSEAELRSQVDRVLNELGIEHIRDARIGDAVRRGISGGQRKRVNLGQELLTRSTRVLFLDEPTSGLDPRAAQDIVRLVRQLADNGRIVFLVTHDLSPQVMAQVDHLLVLATGGRLAYFGPPKDACRYFHVPTADAIFNRFQEKTPREWGSEWRASADFRKFVQNREVLLDLQGRPGTSDPHPPPAAPKAAWHQFRTLVSRYWKVKTRDRTGLLVLAAQPPFLAMVMALVFPKPTSSMLFMLTLSCMWFGMSSAVRELIADRVVWGRERRVGLGVLPYVGSKVAVMGFLVVTQCAFLCVLDWLVFGLGPLGFGIDRLVLVGGLTGLCGMSLGLLMSSLFLSSEAAVGTLPLLLIPQISFSSLLVSLRLMPDLALKLSWLNPLRYGFDAMMKAAVWDENGNWMFGKIHVPPQYGVEWRDAQTITGQLYDLGLKPADPVSDIGLTPGVLRIILLGFTVLFLVGTTIRVRMRRSD